MTEFFDENGHLTTQAISTFINEETSELTRLEISEHLSFCDSCLDNYVNSLNLSNTFIPETSEKSIEKNIKNRLVFLTIHKYISVVTAACLAITLWIIGVFNVQPIEINNTKFNDSLEKTSESIFDFTNNINVSIQEYFNSFNKLKQEEI